MIRLVSRLISLAVFAALAAVLFILFRWGDPLYVAEEWFNRERFSRYDDLIEKTGAKLHLDPKLIKAVIWRESNFYPDKVGANAERGLMQITERAAEEWARAEKVADFQATDLFSPSVNIEAGSWYLARAVRRWAKKDDPLPFALAEYNAGRSRVHRWAGTNEPGRDSTAGEMRQSIDIPSTKKYVNDITNRLRFYKRRGRM